jgi:hypothetical protein
MLFAAFVAANALLLGTWVVLFRALRCGGGALSFVYAGLMAAVQVVATELVLGALGLLRLSLLLGANLAVSLLVLSGAIAVRREQSDEPLRVVGGPAPRRFGWEFAVLLPMLAFVTLWIGVAAVLLPPRGVDDLVYHLPPVYQAVQSERLQLLPLELRDVFAFPFNAELLFLWPLIFFHADTFVDLVPFVVALYGVVVVFATARRLGAPPRSAGFVALLFPFTPVVLGQSGSNYIDVITAVFHLVALLAAASFVAAGGLLHLLMAGVATGFVAGMKYSMLIFVVALQPLLWLRLWRDRGQDHGVLARYAVYVALVLAGAGYWLLRNFVATGSPFYPVKPTLSGFRFDPVSTIGKFIRADAPTVLTDLLRHPGNAFTLPFQDPGLGSLHGGFGAVFWGLSVPSILFCFAAGARRALRERDLFPALFWGQCFVALPAFAMIPVESMPFDVRYVLFVTGLGLAALALAMKRLEQFPGAGFVVRVFCVAASVLAVVQLAGYRWPSYQIRQAVEDRLADRYTSEYRYLRQAGWDLPSLSYAWDPLDFLTRDGDGWSVYMACGYSVFWTAPSFGSRLQNRIWNFAPRAGEWPQAFLFHYDRRGRPLYFVGPPITPEAVRDHGGYDLVAQTPFTRLWVKSSLLRRSDVSDRLAAYDATAFPQALRAAEPLLGALQGDGVVITSSPLGYGFRHLFLTGESPLPVHLTPPNQEEVFAARSGASRIYTIGRPLAGYRARPVAYLQSPQGRLAIYENVRIP